MKTLRNCLVLLIPLALAGCSSLSGFSMSQTGDFLLRRESKVESGFLGIDHIAVVDVVGDIHSEVVKNQIADFYTDQLLKKGYGPVVREYVQHELNARGFDRSDMSLEAYAIEAGRAIAVPAVLIVSVPTFGEELSMTAKLLDVEAGSALWYGHASHREKRWKIGGWFGRSRRASEAEFDAEFRAFMGAMDETPYEMTDEQLMEVALTLKDEKRVLDLVAKICRDLPERVDPMLELMALEPDLWDMAAAPPTYDYLSSPPLAEAPQPVTPPVWPGPTAAARVRMPEPVYVEPEYMSATPPPVAVAPEPLPVPVPVAAAPMPRPVMVEPMVAPTRVPEPAPMYAPARPAPVLRAAPSLRPLMEIAPARRMTPQPGLTQIDPPGRLRRETLLDLAPPRVVPQYEPQARAVIQHRPRYRSDPVAEGGVEAAPKKKKKKKFHWTDLL